MTRACLPTLLRSGLLSGAILAAGTPVRAEPPRPDAADSGALIVTSDSSSYCRTLSGLLQARKALPPEARELKAQGDDMCDQGQVRGGIDRLRRALLVVRETSSRR